MNEAFIYILTTIYAICGIVTFAGFIPTMIDLWKKKPSANISTYIIWTTTMFFTTLYALFINKDLVFIGVASAQLLACLAVLLLRIRLNYIAK